MSKLRQSLWIGAAILVAVGLLAASEAMSSNADTTSIKYHLLLSSNEFRSLQKELDVIAHSHYLVAEQMNQMDDRRQAGWVKVRGWSFSAESVGVFPYNTSSYDGHDERFSADLLVATFTSQRGVKWQQIAKFLETPIHPYIANKTATLELSIPVYGACSSTQRPLHKDVRCQMPVLVPVDFDAANENILRPRLQGWLF